MTNSAHGNLQRIKPGKSLAPCFIGYLSKKPSETSTNQRFSIATKDTSEI